MKESEYYKQEADKANADDKSDFKVFSLLGKAAKAQRNELFVEKLVPLLEKENFVIHSVNEYQHRIYVATTNEAGKFVDYYPKSQKLHIPHQDNKWEFVSLDQLLNKLPKIFK